ncbi:YbgC/FadM family acyl-CoA thioesterase [Helicobacter sp. MIT 14-3879]|uniref:YbgC/FadM family acyl-CoA thioesterase n=1 Tax=Helicobacter sp. MIT 14-3879 TaxID=2040649 RepID=UPI000E1F7C7F|nr:YbgC/FadM family acyl-CoA thioesterase [Helicobacter sp. MIT 14-3879]RDU62450.1 4-hydroxybenzoyl-CoA thioesterase [Helicobacter sp. MIT 14-3879]
MQKYKVRIYYEDTDCGGIVYHTNYIKYCERARSEIFFSSNKTPNIKTIGFVVKSLNANFISSAKLGDLLEIESKILRLGYSSVILKQNIFLKNKLIFECDVRLACIDIINKKIVRIPDEILNILKGEYK